jgi:hypothetical protein
MKQTMNAYEISHRHVPFSGARGDPAWRGTLLRHGENPSPVGRRQRDGELGDTGVTAAAGARERGR